MKALDRKSGESTSTAAPPARAASFTSEAQAEGAAEKAPAKKSGESTSTVAPPVRVRHAMPVRLSSSMVGSVPHKTFAYSDADRQSIKASFALVGIDADAETVGDRWWAQSNPAAALVAEPRRPLLEQLQEMAGDHLGLVELGKSLTPQQRKALNNLKTACVRLNTERLLLFSPHTAGAREALAAVLNKARKPLTPRQEAGELREMLKELQLARAALELLPQFIPETAVAREALTPLIAHVERHHDKCMAEGSWGRFSAHKVHIEYWGRLVLLWQTITRAGAPSQRTRKEALGQFLLACTKPAFSEPMLRSSSSGFRLPTIESRIASFLNKTT